MVRSLVEFWQLILSSPGVPVTVVPLTVTPVVTEQATTADAGIAMTTGMTKTIATTSDHDLLLPICWSLPMARTNSPGSRPKNPALRAPLLRFVQQIRPEGERSFA